jgi:hypothetical protein
MLTLWPALTVAILVETHQRKTLLYDFVCNNRSVILCNSLSNPEKKGPPKGSLMERMLLDIIESDALTKVKAI